MKTPAAAEEQAELQALSERARAAGRELGETAAALIARLGGARNPRAWLNHRAMAAAVPAVLVVVAAAAVLARRRA